MTSSTPITRVTLLKISDEKHQGIALAGFETFTKNQKKEGKPYILSMAAGHASGSAREQGFTLAFKSVFASKEDMEYYETQCPAHLEFKQFLKASSPVEGIMSVAFVEEVGF